jgi:hypothetical protein
MDCAAGLNDVLKVGLDEKDALAEIEPIRQFDDRLGMLAAGGTRQLSIFLGSSQLFAEVTVGDGQANSVPQARVEYPTRRNARR